MTSSSSRRVSAFVRPQQFRSSGVGQGLPIPTPTLLRHTNDHSHLGSDRSSSSSLLTTIPSQLSNTSESFYPAAAAAILPYHHPTPMWASSNVFYHFALPPHSTGPPPPPNPHSVLTDLSSYGRPLHLPSPTGCTIPGCLDCHSSVTINPVSGTSGGRRQSNESRSSHSEESKSPTLDSCSMEVIEVDSGKEDEIIDMK